MDHNHIFYLLRFRDPEDEESEMVKHEEVDRMASYHVVIYSSFSTFFTELGLRRTDVKKKSKYCRVANTIYNLAVALILLTLAATIYPVSFPKGLAKAPAKFGGFG